MKRYEDIFKDYDTISGMNKLQADLGFINTSQTQKFIQTLRKMPSNISPEIVEVMKDSQTIKDLLYEYQILSNWPQKAKEILRKQRDEWSQ